MINYSFNITYLQLIPAQVEYFHLTNDQLSLFLSKKNYKKQAASKFGIDILLQNKNK